MKREIRVQLVKGSKGANLQFRFRVKSASGGEDIVVLSRALNALVMEKELIGGDSTLQVNLHPNNNCYRITFEDNSNYVDSHNNKFKKLAEMFQQGCQFQTMAVKKVKPDGSFEYEPNENLFVHQFDCIDDTANNIQNVVTLKRMVRAMNIVNAMTPSQMKDTLFHFGQDPTGQQPSEMWMRLINPSDGVALNRDRFDEVEGKNGKMTRSALEYFVEDYANRFKKEDDEVFLKTLILKALVIKKDDRRTILERKPSGYMLGEKHLGTELQNVINFIRNNEREREAIKDLVQKFDEVPNDDIPELLKSRGVFIDEKQTREQTNKEFMGGLEQMEHTRNLERARTKYRMQISDDIDFETLKSLLLTANDIWEHGKFQKLPQLLREQPSWTYDQIVEELEKRKVVMKEKVRKTMKEKWAKKKERAKAVTL